MRLDRVVGIRQNHRDPALGVVRGRHAKPAVRLAQHDDPAPDTMGGQRGGQAGDAGADDHDVGPLLPGRTNAHSPPPGRPMAIIRCTLRRASPAVCASTWTSSAPSIRQRNSAAGVIIFMYLHDARSLTARKSTPGAALRSWYNIPTSVATSTWRAWVSRAASS